MGGKAGPRGGPVQGPNGRNGRKAREQSEATRDGLKNKAGPAGTTPETAFR